MDDTSKKKFIDDNRWSLAKQFRDRADFAANIVRSLLFSAAAAGIGFIAHGYQGEALRHHLLSLALFGIGAALVLISWDIQKGKAAKRFDALLDGKPHYDDYVRASCWYYRVWHYVLDRFAAGLIALGVISEISVRLCAP
jgi:hypothetical protein